MGVCSAYLSHSHSCSSNSSVQRTQTRKNDDTSARIHRTKLMQKSWTSREQPKRKKKTRIILFGWQIDLIFPFLGNIIIRHHHHHHRHSLSHSSICTNISLASNLLQPLKLLTGSCGSGVALFFSPHSFHLPGVYALCFLYIVAFPPYFFAFVVFFSLVISLSWRSLLLLPVLVHSVHETVCSFPKFKF